MLITTILLLDSKDYLCTCLLWLVSNNGTSWTTPSYIQAIEYGLFLPIVLSNKRYQSDPARFLEDPVHSWKSTTIPDQKSGHFFLNPFSPNIQLVTNHLATSIKPIKSWMCGMCPTTLRDRCSLLWLCLFPRWADYSREWTGDLQKVRRKTGRAWWIHSF